MFAMISFKIKKNVGYLVVIFVLLEYRYPEL